MARHSIPDEFIADLLARSDIVEWINSRVPLKKAANSYKACCPFHQEKTPSFSVNPMRQYYHCFGCGVGGSLISFLMEYDKLSFVEAIETLAAFHGVDVPKSQQAQQQQRSYLPLYATLQQIADYYQKQLKHSPQAIAYLKQRGLSGQMAKNYSLGYAPAGWELVTREFGTTVQKRQQLSELGMLIHSERGRVYDRFRDRIMFPIRDSRGRVIAFGGRTLGKEEPKYLNSPETPLFHKHQVLYGLYEARQANPSLTHVVVVEGYLDVIALAQQGIHYGVATLGTALSTQHLQLLLRHTKRILFCFDGDAAGQKASWRALEITLPLLRDGIHICFLTLPKEEDPDSFIRKHGKAGWEAEEATAMPLADYLFHGLTKNQTLRSTAAKAELAEQGKTLLKTMPNGVYKQLLLERLAQLVGTSTEQLQHTRYQPTRVLPSQTLLSPAQLATSILLRNPHFSSLLNTTLPAAYDADSQRLLTLLRILQQQPHLTTAQLLEYWREQEDFPLMLTFCQQQSVLNDQALLDELTGALQRTNHEAHQFSIDQLLTKASHQGLTEVEKTTLQKLLKNPLN